MSEIVIMGSGETAPTMVKVHREVMARATSRAGAGPGVLLDTPFGFQLNADDLVRRTLAYFAQSVGTPVEVAGWRRADAEPLSRERSLALLGEAVWAFAGPGSPSYALRQWRDTPVPDALIDLVRRGGTVVFGSAAACTIGTHTVPVYEIYKAGEDPRRLPGLDLLGLLTGIRAMVIPHYDNSEGGTHDTRFCYLGEPRLRLLEAGLPADVGVLGVDEHTALLLDLVTGSARVTGSGTVTIRRGGTSIPLPHGTELPIESLGALVAGRTAPGRVSGGDAPAGGHAPSGDAAPGDAVPDGAVPGDDRPMTSLRAEADGCHERFTSALTRRDVDGAVAATLDLESAIVAWGADTLQSDDGDHARRLLRAQVVRLGALAATGARDPREAITPHVEALLELRRRARDARDFDTADLVRQRLADAGVEVRDTTGGVGWLLRE